MSRLDDYRKFDRIDIETDDDDDDDENDDGDHDAANRNDDGREPFSAPVTFSPPTTVVRGGTTTKHPTVADRYVFAHGGRKVYEWEQSLEEVTVYIDAPLGQLPSRNPASYIVVDISHDRLWVGLRGGDRHFIDERTFDKVKVKESSWYLDREEGTITIVLSKCFRGQTWEGVLCGHGGAGASSDGEDGGDIDSSETGEGLREAIDPSTKMEMQRSLMLERFQEENPGFDFRDATFNGEVPDPRTFMGGVGYNH
jgi:hypothetical protein